MLRFFWWDFVVVIVLGVLFVGRFVVLGGVFLSVSCLETHLSQFKTMPAFTVLASL